MSIADAELLHQAEQRRYDTAGIHDGEKGKERDTEQSSEFHVFGPILIMLSAS
jgi:hypothetical protein